MNINYSLLPLAHEPFVPPRKGFVGENVFAEEWKKLMEEPYEDRYHRDIKTLLEEILSDFPGVVGQKEATICASLVCWLGTNCGRAFLERAEDYARVILSSSDAYIAAWAVENRRCRAVNYGIRILEHCMSKYADSFQGFLKPIKESVELTASDYEVAEHLVAWLCSAKGHSFLERCRSKIKQLQLSIASG